jgi:hypothetical protein
MTEKGHAGMLICKGITLSSIHKHPIGMLPFRKNGRKIICHTKELSKQIKYF